MTPQSLTQPREIARDPLLRRLDGKEVHVRLVTNDLLESGKLSLTALAAAGDAQDAPEGYQLREQPYTEYSPRGLFGALADALSGRGPRKTPQPGVCVLVEEKDGSLSADDARYIEWLAGVKGERPLVLMLPEAGKHARGDGAAPRPLLSRGESERLHSFWRRQWRRVRALPAPITRDAALAAIPRTAIPVGFSLFLAWLKRADVPLPRAAAYVGLAFGFSVGFALFNQTVLNWFTFWSEFSREACAPSIARLEAWLLRKNGGAARGSATSARAARLPLDALAFVSARGDVFIAAPLMGIGTSYLARLALGAVGETASVLTLYGFLLVVLNVVIGSVAGGPYPQVIAHLRAVGKISNRLSMYLSILDTVKMEIGRIADFGMQVLYNAIQVVLAVVFWVLLLIVDRCYQKPQARRLHGADEIESARRLFSALRARAGRDVAAAATL